VLLVNRELGVTDNVEKENMRDFEFDLFFNFDSHLDSHGNARRNDTLKSAAESREESASVNAHTDQSNPENRSSQLCCVGDSSGDETHSAVIHYINVVASLQPFAYFRCDQ
jgi:hypothetical protein